MSAMIGLQCDREGSLRCNGSVESKRRDEKVENPSLNEEVVVLERARERADHKTNVRSDDGNDV